MIVFINEEGAYHSWLARHHQGFVVDALRRPTRKQPLLHRAACADLKTRSNSKQHSTTGRRVKACAEESAALIDWATAEYDRSPQTCEVCRPLEAMPIDSAPARKLSKLGREVMDYVVEVALIHLDQGNALRLSVGEIAAYLGKSPLRIAPAVLQLVQSGLLRLGQELNLDKPFPTRAAIYPTAAALKSLPAYGHWSDSRIEADLRRLRETVE